MPNNVSFGVQAKGVSKASSEVDKLRDKFDKMQKQGAKGILTGVAAGATVGAIGLVSTAVSGLTDIIGDSIQAARDDEVSIQKLGTALKANIANWDGNTDAIERTLKKRINLGFSDDEQRDSLARLVAATHDINKALAIESTAMDLARFKGISLADASDALTKVESGSYRILKSLGIVLKDGATQTEALAAVQAVAAGQAEDFANTNEGKLLVSQTKVNEAMEQFGYKIMPAVTDAMVTGANAIVGFSSTLDLLQNGIGKTADAQQEQLQGTIDLGRAFALLVPGMDSVLNAEQNMLDAQKATSDGSQDAIENMRGTFSSEGKKIEGSLGGVGDAADGMKNDIKKDTRTSAEAFRDLRNSMADDAQSMIDDYFDPIEERAALHETRMSLLAAERARDSAKTVEDQRKASSDIVDSLDEEATHLAKLGAKGKLTNKDIDKFAKDAQRNYSHLSKDARAKIDAIIAKLRALAAFKAFAIQVSANIASAGNKERARGGPVHKGEVYTVGEEGPETFVPSQSGTIIPNGAGVGGMSPAGGGATFNVTVNAGIGSGLTAGDARRLADTIGPAIYADMQRKGYLPRATGLR